MRRASGMTAVGLEALLVHTCTYFSTISGTRDSTATTSAANTILSATCSAGRSSLGQGAADCNVRQPSGCQVQKHGCWLSCSNIASSRALGNYKELQYT